MKKLFSAMVISLALVVILATCAMASNTALLGYDFSGKMSDITTKANTDSGVSLGYEYTVGSGNLEYGAGIEYQTQRKLKDTDAKFNFIPVYGVANYNFKAGDTQPYVTGRLGYNIFQANDTFKSHGSLDDGLYMAVGGGVNFKQYKVGLLYGWDKGTLKNSGDDHKTYGTADLVFGYKF